MNTVPHKESKQLYSKYNHLVLSLNLVDLNSFTLPIGLKMGMGKRFKAISNKGSRPKTPGA